MNATTDGVVLEPSEFSMTLGFLPSIIATQELVVPKSIPITAPFTSVLQVSRWGGGQYGGVSTEREEGREGGGGGVQVGGRERMGGGVKGG